MSAKIYQLPTSLSGTVNVFPNFKYMVTGDNLDAITAAGYLNQIDLQSDPVSVTDIIQVLYDFNPQTQAGTYNAFSVTIVDGIITLYAEISAGNVILPVISGHVAAFSGTSGAITDAGFAAANVARTPTLPVVVNRVPVYSSTGGDLADSSLLLTDLINRNIYQTFSLNAGLFFNSLPYTASAGALSVTSQSGIITTDSLTTAPGLTSTVTITTSFTVVANSSVFLQLRSNGTNTAGNNILFSYNVSGIAQPIVVTILNANSGALDGTLVFSYFVAR